MHKYTHTCVFTSLDASCPCTVLKAWWLCYAWACACVHNYWACFTGTISKDISTARSLHTFMFCDKHIHMTWRADSRKPWQLRGCIEIKAKGQVMWSGRECVACLQGCIQHLEHLEPDIQSKAQALANSWNAKWPGGSTRICAIGHVHRRLECWWRWKCRGAWCGNSNLSSHQITVDGGRCPLARPSMWL